jgi:carbon monoxide dehydrogenase subunit G
MRITNDFDLGLPPEEAYALLLDLDRVVPCMPGAELGPARDDGERDLNVKVKLGPISMAYTGTVAIAERDDDAKRAVVLGTAREVRGQGTARAEIGMTVTPNGDSGSRVAAVADVELTGRAAQTGRGLVEGVAARMVADMARCLDARHGAGAAAAAAAEAPTAPGSATPSPAAAPAPAVPAAAPPIRGVRLLLSVLWDRLRARRR